MQLLVIHLYGELRFCSFCPWLMTSMWPFKNSCIIWTSWPSGCVFYCYCCPELWVLCMVYCTFCLFTTFSSLVAPCFNYFYHCWDKILTSLLRRQGLFNLQFVEVLVHNLFQGKVVHSRRATVHRSARLEKRQGRIAFIFYLVYQVLGDTNVISALIQLSPFLNPGTFNPSIPL